MRKIVIILAVAFLLPISNALPDGTQSSFLGILSDAFIVCDGMKVSTTEISFTPGATKILKEKKLLTIEQWASNPYLKPFLPEAKSKDGKFPIDTTRTASEQVSTVLSSSSITFATVIDKFVSFAITRAQEEMSDAFFEELSTMMDTYPEVSVLLPSTSNCIMHIADNTLPIKQGLQTIKSIFINDLKKLPSNYLSICNIESDIPVVQNRVNKYKEFWTSGDSSFPLELALRVVNSVNNKASVPEIFRSIAKEDYQNKTDSTIKYLVAMCQISNSFCDRNGVYVDFSHYASLLQKMTEDKVIMLNHIYLSFLYMELSKVQDEGILATIVDKDASKITDALTIFDCFTDFINNANMYENELKGKNLTDVERASIYIDYAKLILSTLSNDNILKIVYKTSNGEDLIKIQDGVKWIETGFEFSQSILAKDYIVAFSSTYLLLEPLKKICY